MLIVFGQYLDRIRAAEREKPPGERRYVPTLRELATAVDIHEVTLSKIANGKVSELRLDTGARIISAMRRYGFPMDTTDLIVYSPSAPIE